MAYNEKLQLHIYKYENNTFSQIAIIDDYSEISFERNLYQAGQFTVTINHNLPNASKFEKGLFIQFGSDPYDFGEIRSISDSIGSDGKGSQNRVISGYDCRYLYKRRIIKNLNNNDTWQMTDKGEICLRSLIYSEAGEGAEAKRRLPITNTIPTSQNAIGKEYSVSEAFTNLYDVLVTIATQSEIGWRVKFENNSLSLECYQGEDRSTTVQFSTDFETLSNGTFTDTNENFSNAVYVGGKGDGSERDIYEGESAINNSSPSGFDRFECWDNQSEMNTEDEYSKEALSMLTQYGQTLTVNGNGLAKSIYVYKEQYNVGDIISISFSGRKANVQILSVTEHWTGRGNYGITFSFGKPVNNLADQIKLLLNKIQIASSKANTIDSVKWYEFSNANLSQNKKDVTFNSIGFTGSLTANRTFTFYLDDEGTGSKIYNIYAKNLSGNYNVTLTTGKSGATNAVIKGGVNLVARVYIDVSGNVVLQSMSATDTIESGNNQPATSNGVASIISDKGLVATKTDNAIARWDGTAGKLKNSGVTINNNNNVTTNGAVTSRGYIKNWTQLDLSALDKSKWFPVTVPLEVDDWTEVVCYVSLDSGTKPSWSAHSLGFTCHLHLLAMGSGWVTTSAQTLLLDMQYSWTRDNINPCGWSQMINSSTGVLWLRGGGKYRVWNNKNHAFTIRTSAYTINQQTVEPRTSYVLAFNKAQMYGNIDGIATQANVACALSNGVTCSTAAGTAAKTVSLTGFVFNKGAKLLINVSNANTAASALTLNVNDTGAKIIKVNGTVTSTSYYTLAAGWYNCYYDGTYWNMDSSYEAYNARNAGLAGQADISRGNAYCITAAATAAKEASMRGYTLRSGNCFPITFINSNSAQSALTLNVNNTGAKPIHINNAASSASNYKLNSGTYLCWYNGTNYYIDTGCAVTTARNADALGGTSLSSLKTYIKNQNKLSAPESFSLTTSDQTLSYDGFIYIKGVVAGGNETGYLVVNNVNTVCVYRDTSGSATYPVNKGDKVRLSSSWIDGSIYARWYKNRDYT